VPVSAAAPAPLLDWSGFYIGANFAWSLGRSHDTYFNGTRPLPIARDSFRGPFGGVELGYCRMAASPVVLCGEVEADFGSARGTNNAFTALAANTYVTSTTTVDWRVTVGPKLGVAVDANRLFIYATGGGAFADVAFEATSTIVGRVGAGSSSGTRAGWVRRRRHGAAAHARCRPEVRVPARSARRFRHRAHWRHLGEHKSGGRKPLQRRRQLPLQRRTVAGRLLIRASDHALSRAPLR
jgi:hypothetical protein